MHLLTDLIFEEYRRGNPHIDKTICSWAKERAEWLKERLTASPWIRGTIDQAFSIKPGNLDRQVIDEAIGEASMCWEPIPSGVFLSERANKIVDKLVQHFGQPQAIRMPEEKFDDITLAEKAKETS